MDAACKWHPTVGGLLRLASGLFFFSSEKGGDQGKLRNSKAGGALRDWEGHRQTYFTSPFSPRPPLLVLAVRVQPCCGGHRPGLGICARPVNDESEARGAVSSKGGLGSRCLGRNLSSLPRPAGCHALFILVWHSGASL